MTTHPNQSRRFSWPRRIGLVLAASITLALPACGESNVAGDDAAVSSPAQNSVGEEVSEVDGDLPEVTPDFSWPEASPQQVTIPSRSNHVERRSPLTRLPSGRS